MVSEIKLEQERVNKVIKLLRKHVEELENVTDKKAVELVSSNIIRTMIQIYGNNSQEKNDAIREYSNKKYLLSMLNGVIDQIKAFGLPKNNFSSGNGICLNNNVYTEQNQCVNIDIIIEFIQNELTQETLNEIKTILTGNEIKETKMQKIINILKNCGMEVISSILAQIILKYCI